VIVATLNSTPYTNAPDTLASRGMGGFGTSRRNAGPKRTATPAIAVSTAAPTANPRRHPASRRPRSAAAVPNARSARTSPRKNASPRRVALGAPPSRDSRLVPTYPTIPTPAGTVQGQVLVDRSPPAMATRIATSGYCAIAPARRSMKSAGFMWAALGSRDINSIAIF